MKADQALGGSVPRPGPARNTPDALLRLQDLRDQLLAERPDGIEAWRRYLVDHWPADSAALAGLGYDDAVLAIDAIGSARGFSGKASQMRAHLRRLEREQRRVARRHVSTERYALDLDLNQYQQPKKHISNVQAVLEGDPDLSARVAWSEFSEQLEVDGQAVTDVAITDLQLAMHARYQLDPGPDMLLRVAERYARLHRSYHPVRAYLEGLRWDGVPRLGRLLADYLGAEDTPLHAAYSTKTLVALVRRVMDPGCKVDTVLILQGKQGRGKSTALRVLAGQWFADGELDPGTKDAQILLRGVWLYELGEFEKWLSRSNLATIKALVTRQVETYRPPYGRCAIEQPRQVVLIGTTNAEEILTDPTGHRRFWVVRTGDIDLERLRRDRDQLWAEAVAAWTAGAETYLTPEEVEAHASASTEFEAEDPRQSVLAGWLADQMGADGWTTAHILQHALGLETAKVKGSDGRELATMMRRLGWVNRRSGTGMHRAQRWYRA